MTTIAPESGNSHVSQGSFALRPATKDDLDDIARIHIEGFTQEPCVLYCYPGRHEYPDDHWKWTRREYENYLAQPEKYVVHLLVSIVETRDTTADKPVGVAVWNMAPLVQAIAAGTLKITPCSGPASTNSQCLRRGPTRAQRRKPETLRSLQRSRRKALHVDVVRGLWGGAAQPGYSGCPS